MDDDCLTSRESALSYRGTDYIFYIKTCWDIEKAVTENGEKAQLCHNAVTPRPIC